MIRTSHSNILANWVLGKALLLKNSVLDKLYHTLSTFLSLQNVREIFKGGKTPHKKLKPKGNIDLRLNTFIGNTKESHPQVGGIEIDTPKLGLGPLILSIGVPGQKYLSGSQPNTNPLWRKVFPSQRPF